MTHNDGQGPVEALIAAVSASLADPPIVATRVMAFVLDAAGQGDHLGLWLGGQPTPGGLDLLSGATSAGAQPRAEVEAVAPLKRRDHGRAAIDAP